MHFSQFAMQHQYEASSLSCVVRKWSVLDFVLARVPYHLTHLAMYDACVHSGRGDV